MDASAEDVSRWGSAERATKHQQIASLRASAERKRAEIDSHREQIALISSENAAKQQTVEALESRLADLTVQLHSTDAFGESGGKEAADAARATQEAHIAKFMHKFESALEWTLEEYTNKQKDAEGRVAMQTIDRCVSVTFCPSGEPSPSDPVQRFWVADGIHTSNFRELRSNAARYWQVSAESFMLLDDMGAQWPLEAEVASEIGRVRKEMVICMVAKSPEENASAELDEALESKLPFDDNEPLENVAALLGAQMDEERAELNQEQAALVAALADDESDSEDDGNQREAAPQPPPPLHPQPLRERVSLYPLFPHLSYPLFSLLSHCNPLFPICHTSHFAPFFAAHFFAAHFFAAHFFAAHFFAAHVFAAHLSPIRHT